MSIFDKLNKKEKNNNDTTENGVSGPIYLDRFTENFKSPKKLHSHEWRRKLRVKSGHSKFKIKYYGDLNEDYGNLITGDNFAPALIFAVNTITEEEILLFDGCKHGYNAMFCDSYSKEQINDRLATKIYSDKNGNQEFELIISTYNGIDYEDEFRSDVDANGLIEIIDGTKIEFEIVKRNGFDTLKIYGLDEQRNKIEIASEELA